MFLGFRCKFSAPFSQHCRVYLPLSRGGAELSPCQQARLGARSHQRPHATPSPGSPVRRLRNQIRNSEEGKQQKNKSVQFKKTKNRSCDPRLERPLRDRFHQVAEEYQPAQTGSSSLQRIFRCSPSSSIDDDGTYRYMLSSLCLMYEIF